MCAVVMCTTQSYLRERLYSISIYVRYGWCLYVVAMAKQFVVAFNVKLACGGSMILFLHMWCLFF